MRTDSVSGDGLGDWPTNVHIFAEDTTLGVPRSAEEGGKKEYLLNLAKLNGTLG